MKARDLFELLLLAAIWGASFLFLRVATPAVGALGVAACRVVGSALLLMPLVLWRGEGASLRRHAPHLVGAALLSCILPFLGLGQASRNLSASLLSILNATTPMWGALVGWLWAGERLSPLRVVGLALGFAGVAVLAADGAQLDAPGAHGAVLLALGATLMYAFSVHYNKRYLAALSPLANSAGTLAMSGALLMLPALWLGPQPALAASGPSPAWTAIPLPALQALLALTLVCTGLAYFMFYGLMERIGGSRALTVTFLIPVFGMLWGALFLHEQVTPAMLLSTGIVLLGTWLSNHGAQQAARQAHAPAPVKAAS
jgi:drug/metabolite transporter (DMT)-like permease